MGGVTPCVSYIRYNNKKSLPKCEELEMKLIFFSLGIRPPDETGSIRLFFLFVYPNSFLLLAPEKLCEWNEEESLLTRHICWIIHRKSKVAALSIQHLIPNSSGNWRMFVCLFVVLIFVCWWMKAQEETRSRLFAAPLAGRVLLRNVTAAAEGVYKCEVSTEAPYFDTDYEEANLSVVGKSIIQISDLNFPARI